MLLQYTYSLDGGMCHLEVFQMAWFGSGVEKYLQTV